MWSRIDNQEVGLEAATLERVRNSSLVKRFCAENIRGSSCAPKSWDLKFTLPIGRGAFRKPQKHQRKQVWRYRK